MTIQRGAKAAVFVIILTIASIVLAAGAVGAEAATQSYCGMATSPYSLTAAQRAACGDRVTQLTHVEPIPQGGEEYVYDGEESQTRFPVPPASFDAVTASDEELATYDIPTRPSPASPTYGRWLSMAEHLHVEPPPSEIISVPIRAASLNWSGYANTASSQIYKEAAAWFTEPEAKTTSCGEAAAVTWVGLGGLHSKQLAQAGTSVGEDGLAEGEFWWEILPEYPSVLPMSKFYEEGGSLKPRELGYASVKELSSTEFQFYVETEKFQSHGFTTKTNKNGYDGSSADYIVERPEHSGTGTYFNLKNFGEVGFEPRTNGSNIESFGHESIEMKNPETGHKLAAPGPLSSGLFTDYHYNCK